MKIDHDPRRALRSRRFPIAMVVGALSMHGIAFAQNRACDNAEWPERSFAVDPVSD